jgi:uncharacterized membrane-anchored protein
MKILAISFVIMCLGQWAIPAFVINEQLQLRANGKKFHFETEPVDPKDPFRGNFISLYFKATDFTSTETWNGYEEAYVILTADSNGFAQIKQISRTEPDDEDVSYIKATVYSSGENSVSVDYPFDRFYLEENVAPEAEKVYNNMNRNDTRYQTYAVVYVQHGKASVEDVIVKDKSIVEWVKEKQGNL